MPERTGRDKVERRDHIVGPTPLIRCETALTRDQEFWGAALWVEKHHGEKGWFFIAQQKDRLIESGDLGCIAMWSEVERRLGALQPRPAQERQSLS